MQWATSYDELRAADLRGGPVRRARRARHDGARRTSRRSFSLHTKAKIESVTAEFPAQTTITRTSAQARSRGRHTVYEVAFRKLGENMLTITHDGGRKTYLEFFVTEPMETLIKKRAAFLVNKQQIQRPVEVVERRVRRSTT